MNTPAMIIDFEATDVSKEAEATQLGYRKKDQQDLIALRQKVQNLAGENIKLRAHIKNARECLDKEYLS